MIMYSGYFLKAIKEDRYRNAKTSHPGMHGTKDPDSLAQISPTMTVIFNSTYTPLFRKSSAHHIVTLA